MVDGGFFLAVISGNGKGRNDPETMRQQKIQRIEQGDITKALAHECCRATQRRRFFDTFPYAILLARQLLMTMLTVGTTE